MGIPCHNKYCALISAAPEYSLDHDYVKAAECESPEVHFTVISEPPLAEDAKHMLTDENGKAATKRFKIHVNCVTFHNVKPSDSGVYTISCRNEAGVIGEETLELDITAAGHPTPSAWKSGENVIVCVCVWGGGGGGGPFSNRNGDLHVLGELGFLAAVLKLVRDIIQDQHKILPCRGLRPL